MALWPGPGPRDAGSAGHVHGVCTVEDEPQRTRMDNSNLFSHPDAPEYVGSGENAGKPVEHPTFSDAPDADAARRPARGS